jgi:hypothetical protein
VLDTLPTKIEGSGALELGIGLGAIAVDKEVVEKGGVHIEHRQPIRNGNLARACRKHKGFTAAVEVRAAQARSAPGVPTSTGHTVSVTMRRSWFPGHRCFDVPLTVLL